MATSTAAQKAPRARAPDVNLFDMPELMPGAQPSATPAQREEFEQRCRQLHRDEVSERMQEVATERIASGAHATYSTYSELEAMFPMLDAALVRSLAAEAPTPQAAIETLLALSAAFADPVVGSEGTAAVRAATPPPRELGVEDHEKFPTLVDADGWQVATQRLLERDQEEDLGSVWRDRAKAAKDLPAPKPQPAASTLAPVKKRQPKEKERDPDQPPQQEFLTDYEFRQKAGQRRAIRRAQYGRGRGAAARTSNPAFADDTETEDEEEAAGGGEAAGEPPAPAQA